MSPGCSQRQGTLPQRESIVHPEHLVSSRGDAGAIPVPLDDQQGQYSRMKGVLARGQAAADTAESSLSLED